MTPADVSVKLLFQESNNEVSGDDSANKGSQLPLIDGSYIIKETEKQLRS